MVARTAGGREVAGSNPVTPIPWQGHGRRSDPSGGLRKRETVYCGVSFFYVIGNSFLLHKNVPRDVQLAVRYNALHTAGASVRQAHTLFLGKKEGIEKPGRINL